MAKWLSILVLLSFFKFEVIKIVKFCVILLSWIRICILNADPDPADQNRCGFVRIRIRNTVFYPVGKIHSKAPFNPAGKIDSRVFLSAAFNRLTVQTMHITFVICILSLGTHCRYLY